MPSSGWYQHAYRANQAVDRGLIRVRRRLGLAQPPVLLPYRGFGRGDRALIRGRVVEDRDLDLGDGSTRRRLAVAWRRYATWELADEPVVFTWNGRRYHGHTDSEGYIDLWVEPPPDARDGWNRLCGRLARDTAGEEVELDVFMAGDRAEYGVISDIDDTVIETGATNLLKRAHALFWAAAEHRLPFEGVAGFYQALAKGSKGTADNPIFYLSSSPWNLYPHLIDLLAMHDIPTGPMLLRDWGFGPEGFAPDGKHRHKLDKARTVLDTFSDLPFILFGDSGQEDARHYATLVEAYGDRIRAVYLRDVGRRKHDFRRQVDRMLDVGVPVLVAADTLAAVRHAEAMGFVPPTSEQDVQRERARDLDA